MKKLKVIAAMSGGVDSAVAAARAVDAGYEVAQELVVAAQLKIHMMQDEQLM
jgi:tRNA U34 2-thiouridine synthase MnmA/TrmU